MVKSFAVKHDQTCRYDDLDLRDWSGAVNCWSEEAGALDPRMGKKKKRGVVFGHTSKSQKQHARSTAAASGQQQRCKDKAREQQAREEAYYDQQVEQCQLFGYTQPDAPSPRTQDFADRYCPLCNVLFHAWDAQTTHVCPGDLGGAVQIT